MQYVTQKRHFCEEVLCITRMLIFIVIIVILFNKHLCEWVEISQTFRKGSSIVTVPKKHQATTYEYNENLAAANHGESSIPVTKPTLKSNRRKGLVDERTNMEELDQVVLKKQKLNLSQPSFNVTTTTEFFKTSIGSPFEVTKSSFEIEENANRRVDVSRNNWRNKLNSSKTQTKNINKKVTTLDYDESQIEESTTEKNKQLISSKKEDGTDETESASHGDREGFSGILPVIKEIHQNMQKFEGRTIKSKISFLSDLKDRISYDIKNRISNLFSQKSYETAKGYYEDDSHMEFPSNEGALMTIGFLTFAAFLVKLVLKLIYTLKYKQMYYFPQITTTTTTAASIFLKQGRSLQDDDMEVTKAAKILDAIGKTSSKYQDTLYKNIK